MAGIKKRGRPTLKKRDKLVSVFAHISADEKRHIKKHSSNQSKWIRKSIQSQIKRDIKNK